MTDVSAWETAQFVVLEPNGATKEVHVSGRDRWALETLLAANTKGVTPIDNPAPRWSGYVHNLRKMGVDIETIHETHMGPFPGTHARYVLRSFVLPSDAETVE